MNQLQTQSHARYNSSDSKRNKTGSTQVNLLQIQTQSDICFETSLKPKANFSQIQTQSNASKFFRNRVNPSELLTKSNTIRHFLQNSSKTMLTQENFSQNQTQSDTCFKTLSKPCQSSELLSNSNTIRHLLQNFAKTVSTQVNFSRILTQSGTCFKIPSKRSQPKRTSHKF